MIRKFLERLFGDRDEEQAREDSKRVRETSAIVDQHARTAIERARPTGMPLRDMMTGAYDPHDPLYRGRRTQP